MLICASECSGSPLFLQTRAGRQQTVCADQVPHDAADIASVATHLADVSAITPLGAFLRRTNWTNYRSWNVLRGEMSLIDLAGERGRGGFGGWCRGNPPGDRDDQPNFAQLRLA